MKNVNSQSLAIGLAMGVTFALIMTLIIKFSSKESWKYGSYAGLSTVNNKHVGPRAKFVSHSWNKAKQYTGDLKKTMQRFSVPIHPTDDYVNYCRLKQALGNCGTNGTECYDECR
jgi:hypothetical protein